MIACLETSFLFQTDSMFYMLFRINCDLYISFLFHLGTVKRNKLVKTEKRDIWI